MDPSLIANKIIEDSHRKKTEGVAIKFEVQRAFDKVGLDYLDEMLKVKGFGDKWR